MTTRYVPGLLLLALSLAPCRGAVLYVNQHAPGPTHDGRSWGTAFVAVQQGIDAALAGDEIWVAAGTYKENIAIRKEMSLYGGFSGTETQRSQRDWRANATTLDGGGNGRVVIINAGAGSTQMAVVDGFVVENGGEGGFNVWSDAVVANCVIAGNATVRDGLGYGGGIIAQGGRVSFVNDLIIGNLADQGGGISSSGGQLTLVNSTVVGNRAGAGGAIYARGTGTLNVVNSLIAGNDSGIFRSGGTVTLSHSNVTGNTAYNFSGMPDPTGTDGNLSVDPKLSPFTTGLHLQPGSPCIDAGDDSVVAQGETDFSGKPRLLGGHVDIGADESDGTAYPAPAPRVWHVSTAGDDAGDGASWGGALRSVPLALLCAEAGDEVWVAEGTYRCASRLRSGVGLYGGFAGTETDRSQRDPVKHVTVLDGVVRKTQYGTYVWTVLTLPAEATPDTVVDGFTIQNGEGLTGAGIAVQGGSPTISHNTFRNNGLAGTAWDSTKTTFGGGLYIGGGDPTVSANTFTHNSATCGGGVFVMGGTARITGNTFSGNVQVTYGGAVCVAAGTPLVSGNTITGNDGEYGGGVYADSGLIRDNLIAGNKPLLPRDDSGGGGGLYIRQSAVAVHNRVIDNQESGDYPGAGGAVCDAILMDNVFQDSDGAIVAALACYSNSVVRRNTITDSRTEFTQVQVDSYGGTITDNLCVFARGHGIGLRSSPLPVVVANNTLVNVGPAETDLGPQVGIVSAYHSGEQGVISNNILIGWGIAGIWWGPSGTTPTFTVNSNLGYANGVNTLTYPGTQAGNISADPRFVDPAHGDYRLQAGSPCVDTGDDSAVAEGDRDLLGAPRISGAHVDIGCYEYGSPAWTMLDAAEVLKVAAGLSRVSPAEVSRLDVAANGSAGNSLTVLDATRIAQWLLN